MDGRWGVLCQKTWTIMIFGARGANKQFSCSYCTEYSTRTPTPTPTQFVCRWFLWRRCGRSLLMWPFSFYLALGFLRDMLLYQYSTNLVLCLFAPWVLKRVEQIEIFLLLPVSMCITKS